mgnify:CR=1 FL=1
MINYSVSDADLAALKSAARGCVNSSPEACALEEAIAVRRIEHHRHFRATREAAIIDARTA